MSLIFSYLVIVGIVLISLFYVFSIISKNIYFGCIIGYTVCFFSVVFFDNILLSTFLGTFFYTLYMSITFVKKSISRNDKL